jgi:hypothetical protein
MLHSVRYKIKKKKKKETEFYLSSILLHANVTALHTKMVSCKILIELNIIDFSRDDLKLKVYKEIEDCWCARRSVILYFMFLHSFNR